MTSPLKEEIQVLDLLCWGHILVDASHTILDTKPALGFPFIALYFSRMTYGTSLEFQSCHLTGRRRKRTCVARFPFFEMTPG